MAKTIRRLGLLALALLLATTGACITITSDKKPDSKAPPTPVYMDFEDVKVPGSMARVYDDSYLFESRDVKAGVMALSGWDNPDEVMTFFKEHMAQDGWTLLSTFKYKKDILIFTKPDKVCLILARAPLVYGKTNVEIWVSPTDGGSTAGNPGDWVRPKPSNRKTPSGRSKGLKEEPLKDADKNS
jgi:hypothetical protein